MKRKAIRIGLLVAGVTLVCVSLVLTVSATANKSIIGGADLPTFFYVLFHEGGGVYGMLALLGVISIVMSKLVAGVRKKR